MKSQFDTTLQRLDIGFKITWVLSFFLIVVAACMVAPKMDGDEIATNPDGSTKYGLTTPGNAKKRMEAALNSKGFKRYKADVQQIAAMEWIRIAKWSFILSGVMLLAWYFTKTREFGGAAILCIGFSLVAVMLAKLLASVWFLILLGACIVLIVIGFIVKDKTLFAFVERFRKRKVSTE